MNNIMEYQRVLANCTNTNSLPNSLPNLKSTETTRNILEDLNRNNTTNQEDNPVLYTMENGIQKEYVISERLDKLFHKLHHLQHIDANGCIMIKPPKLRRSYNTYNIDHVNNRQFNVNALEEKTLSLENNLRILEETMNIEERLSLYENRLNKLQEFIICKNEKNLYNEN